MTYSLHLKIGTKWEGWENTKAGEGVRKKSSTEGHADGVQQCGRGRRDAATPEKLQANFLLIH